MAYATRTLTLCLVLVLGFYPQVLAGGSGSGAETDDETVSDECMVHNLNAAPFIDRNFIGYAPCSPTTHLCQVILNVSWTQPVNQSCVSNYIVKIEKAEISGSVQPQGTSACVDAYSASVDSSATHLVLGRGRDVALWTHCKYNVSIITQSTYDNVSRSVSVLKNSAKLKDEAPEIVLVLKEWLPQPNGSYHLRSVFYIENFIHGFIIPQGRSVGTADAEVKLWYDGPNVHVEITEPPLRNSTDRYGVEVWTELNIAPRDIEKRLKSKRFEILLAAPVLPPGVVQHLAVASEVAAGNQMELSIQWGAPVVVYTTGEVEYDVLVQSGSGAWEIWDNRSAVNTYRAKNTSLSVFVETDGAEWILVSVRGVNVEYGVVGNWTDKILSVPAHGPSDGLWFLIRHVVIALLPIVLPLVAAAVIIFLLSMCVLCVCLRYYPNKRYLRKVVIEAKDKTLTSGMAFDHIISRGNFGSIFSAHFLDERANKIHKVAGDRVVAKVIPACKDTKADVQREMDILHILKQGNCDNVVRMFDFGWDSTGTLATIVMEFVMYGSLLEYLQWSGRKMQNCPDQEEPNPTVSYNALGVMSEDDQLYFAVQIARGMLVATLIMSVQPTALEYVSGCGIIHCDLAARNVLLGREKTAKITDFGLAQIGTVCTLYQKELPFRWMAPEAIVTRQASTKTDVWAFGVTLWEIFSYGVVPLSDMTNDQVIEAATADHNCLLTQPQNCWMDVWNVMLECWDTTQQNRPDFTQLTELLSDIWFAANDEDVGKLTVACTRL